MTSFDPINGLVEDCGPFKLGRALALWPIIDPSINIMAGIVANVASVAYIAQFEQI